LALLFEVTLNCAKKNDFSALEFTGYEPYFTGIVETFKQWSLLFAQEWQ
jgi:hypothetical protein